MASAAFNRFPSGKFKTSAGYRLKAAPPALPFPSTLTGLLEFARDADAASDQLLAAGQVASAERLAHAAYEARCRAEAAS